MYNIYIVYVVYAGIDPPTEKKRSETKKRGTNSNPLPSPILSAMFSLRDFAYNILFSHQSYIEHRRRKLKVTTMLTAKAMRQ